MTSRVIWSTVIAAIASLLQSTLLAKLEIFHVVPDISLCIIVYVAYLNGPMTGQIVGFSSGIVADLISASPLGFNAIIRVVVGFLTGLLKGSFFLDIAVLPIALCAAATLLKALLAWVLHVLFAGAVPCYSLSNGNLWIELGYNSIVAPLLFAFLNLFKTVLKPRQEE